MNEIVKYHNDFNKIKLPSFNEIEQNLLCFLLTKIKEKQKNEMITLYPKDLTGFSEKNLSNREITEILNSFENKFFKADFTIILKDEVRNLIGKMRVNLFNYFVIWKKWRDKYNMELGILDAWEEFTHIEIQVNPQFEYILNQLTANFTAFELTEFIALSGKYTKTLYRLLKQYRATGKVYFKWEEFRRIIDIPENKKMGEIERDILKPAIKELSKERNLFDQKRTPFKNLAYEKEKQKGTRGRGGKVSGIIFTFTPESILMQKLEKESEKIETPEQKYFKILNNMRQNQVRFIYKNQLWQFNDFNFDEFKIIAVELIRDEYENLNFGNHMRFTAESQEQFFKMIDTFRNQIR